MTIRELLETDREVNEINVIVWDEKDNNNIKYVIGENAEPDCFERFTHTTKAGEMYQKPHMKVLIIKKNIQLYNLREKGNGSYPDYGILFEESTMGPYGCPYDNKTHGYLISCDVPMWQGIQGENEVIEHERTDNHF
jgi:hypothetical protein